MGNPEDNTSGANTNTHDKNLYNNDEYQSNSFLIQGVRGGR